MNKLLFLLFPVLFILSAGELIADVPVVNLVGEAILEDSEEPFSRRIYSYDFDYDSNGNIHLVYSIPVVGENRAVIIYTHGAVSNLLANKTILSTNGKHGSVSTWIRVDSTDKVHISYIQFQNDPETSLWYQTVTNGTPGTPVKVAPGGWHTKMDLNHLNEPVFLRDGMHKMVLYVPFGSAWIAQMITLPDERYFRSAQLVYDVNAQRYNISYGDDYLAKGDGTYYSRYKYAYSDDGTSWTSSTIHSTPTLWQLEFWTDLIVSESGNVFAGMMEHNPSGDRNATGLFGRFVSGSWQTKTIAGTVCPVGDAAAGMGAGYAFDSTQGIYGVWDNSPDTACNGYDGVNGNIILGYSPDGWNNWQDVMQLKGFSAEGRCDVAIHGDRLGVLVLGDHANTRLHFMEYSIPKPLDTDKDGIPDIDDPDDDNDTILDINDNCPLISNLDQLDTDTDGQGNVCDPDDDNDGVSDVLDAFPLDPSESKDTDNDGIGNNADTDDDNDGLLDINDNCPEVVNPDQSDKDNNGIGDVCEQFPWPMFLPALTRGNG